MTRGRVAVLIWGVLTLAAITWLVAGNIRTEFGPLVAALSAVSVGYGFGRIIALRRMHREGTVTARAVPLRICAVILGLITFGPTVAAMFGWIGILPASGGFAAGIVLFPVIAALFSDGYQGLWLDSLVFFKSLAPPEDDWVLRR